MADQSVIPVVSEQLFIRLKAAKLDALAERLQEALISGSPLREKRLGDVSVIYCYDLPYQGADNKAQVEALLEAINAILAREDEKSIIFMTKLMQAILPS